MKEENLESAPFTAVKQSWARTETVRTVSGKRYGCWSNGLTEACNSTSEYGIEEGGILFSQHAGTCASGKDITIITYS